MLVRAAYGAGFRAFPPRRGLMGAGARKPFFSEEKNQKIFRGAVADLAGGTRTFICKVFCFFSSEKKIFLP
jgi:hypothetical protein